MKTSSTEVTAQPNIIDFKAAQVQQRSPRPNQRPIPSADRTFAQRGPDSIHAPSKNNLSAVENNFVLRELPKEVKNRIDPNNPKQIAKEISEMSSSNKLSFVNKLKDLGLKGLNHIDSKNVEKELSGPHFEAEFVAAFSRGKEAASKNLVKASADPIGFTNKLLKAAPIVSLSKPQAPEAKKDSVTPLVIAA